MLPLLAMLAVPAFAADLELDNLTKSDLEKVGNEFAVNFSHTAVAAPETDGLWGVEVGLIAGATGSPKLKDVVDDTGNDGDDFKSLYHAGLMARVHVPFDIFLEATLLPEREISEVEVKNRTFGIGWNAGAFFGLPLDLAVGANVSASELSFDQTINNASTSNTDVDSTINLDSKTRVLWVGVSKTFLFATPYIKVGTAHSESEIDVDTTGGTGTIFAFSNKQSEDVDTNGGFLVAGANLQLAFFKLGFEWGQTAGVRRASGKLSFDF